MLMDLVGAVLDVGFIGLQAWVSGILSDWPSLESLLTELSPAATALAAIGLPSRLDKRSAINFKSVQEHSGIHLEISRNLEETGTAATVFLKTRYDAWLDRGWASVDTRFKYDYFTVAVGGGKTMKIQYQALLDEHAHDIDWLEHVRFFFLEESSGEESWESSRSSLAEAFITPLAALLMEHCGQNSVADRLGLVANATAEEITQAVIELMTHPIEVEAIHAALEEGDPERARELANSEATRYCKLIKNCVGESMSFHLIISGIARDGGIGAFSPYHPALKKKAPGVVILEQNDGALRIALNRGVFTSAERISLIISGTMKLNALGRFEMDDYAPFEQTVMETPLRMLRENEAIAEKVYVFADDDALHFAEGVLLFTEGGKKFRVRGEVREGLESNGIIIQLVHGFMGLYSHINLIIKLPSNWEVSALHRGKKAKKMPESELLRRLQLCIIDPPVSDEVLLALSFAGASGSIRNTTTTSSLYISTRLTSALMMSRLVLKSTVSSVTSIFLENSSSRSITKNSSYCALSVLALCSICSSIWLSRIFRFLIFGSKSSLSIIALA